MDVPENSKHGPDETASRKDALVLAMSYAPSFRAACEMAGVNPSTGKYWRANDEDFAARLLEAREEGRDRLREAIHKRGVEGYERPVFYKGEVMYRRHPVTGELLLDDNFEPVPVTEWVVSDRLMERVAEANLPEYRKGGASVGVEVPGQGEGSKPVRIVVNFVEPPDWDNVEWDEETGRPRLDPLDS